MQYHPDDFLRLMEAVEDAGGAMLAGRCMPKRFRLRVPRPGGGKRWKDFGTAGCGQEALFEVPYELPKGDLGAKMEKRGGGSLRVCAVDDDLGKWPRFSDNMEEDSF